VHEAVKVETHQRVELLLAMHHGRKTRAGGDVDQGLRDGAGVGSSLKAVLVFGDFLGDLDGIVPDRAERRGQFFC
jgi:hypothetical protein